MIRDAASLHISWLKVEKRIKGCGNESLWEKKKNDMLLDDFEWINNNFQVQFKGLGINYS